MRKTKLFALLVISACMLTVMPVMAKKGGVTFKANGKLTHYADVDEDPGSVIVKGQWDLKIKDGVVATNDQRADIPRGDACGTAESDIAERIFRA